MAEDMAPPTAAGDMEMVMALPAVVILWVGDVDTFGTAVGGDMVWVPAGGGRRLDPFGFAAEGYVSSSSQGLLRNARFPTYL